MKNRPRKELGNKNLQFSEKGKSRTENWINRKKYKWNDMFKVRVGIGKGIGKLYNTFRNKTT